MVQVTKRSGAIEALDLDKIHRVLTWAKGGDGTDFSALNVSISSVEIASQLQFNEGIRTSDIHQVLIRSAEGLATTDNPDYLQMTARLGFFDIRKRAYGGFTPPHLFDHIMRCVAARRYTDELVHPERGYTQAEMEFLNGELRHERDLDYPYSAYKEFMAKYLVRNKLTNQLFESPQMAFMCLAMTAFIDEPVGERLTHVLEFYHLASTLKVNLPTPIIAGVRTREKQFSSCIKIDVGDSIDSLSEGLRACMRYISKKAGIGINLGENRGVKGAVRDGEATNTGIVNFVKAYEYVVNSTNQGSIRKGSATVYFPWFHLEFPELIVLKSNIGTHETTARGLDFGLQLNGFILERARKKQMIKLFSPRAVPGLYDAFFADQDEFRRLYEKYEADPSIPYREMNAYDLITTALMQRINTGRIYFHFVDNVNDQSPWDPRIAPIRMSNLCIEIGIPTSPIGEDPDGELTGDDARDLGEIGVCTLSAHNLGDVDVYTSEGLADLEHRCYYLVRFLNRLLDYQDYAAIQAKRSTFKYRPLGIGVINGAYYLAKNGKNYSTKGDSPKNANQLVHDTFEAIAFYSIKASIDMARVYGAPCPGYADTRWAQGLLPIDRYNRNVDRLVPNGAALRMPWDELRADLAQYGILNVTLLAQMPSETSSRVSGATNAMDPPQSRLSIKSNNTDSIKILAPESDRYEYEFAWDMPDNRGLLQIYAIMQKWICQLISANTFYVPERYPDHKLPMSEVMRDTYYSHQYGIKSHYYLKTEDGQKDDHTVARPAREDTVETVAVSEIVEATPRTPSEDELFAQQLADSGCAGGACSV